MVPQVEKRALRKEIYNDLRLKSHIWNQIFQNYNYKGQNIIWNLQN